MSMSKDNLKQKNEFIQSVERLKRLGIIKQEKKHISYNSNNIASHSKSQNKLLNISLNASNNIVQKLSNPFIKKTIKISVPLATTEISTPTEASTSQRRLRLQVRKCEIPSTGLSTTFLKLKQNEKQPIGSPVLYPNCSKCGATLDNLPEFQKRIAGFESNFLIDFVCIRCVKQRQAIALDKKKYEDLAVEIVQKKALNNSENHLEDTYCIENVESGDIGLSDKYDDDIPFFKKEYNENLDNYDTEYLDSDDENVDSSRNSNTTSFELCSTQQEILCASSPVSFIGNIDFIQKNPQLSSTQNNVPSSPEFIDDIDFNDTNNLKNISPSMSPIKFDENLEFEENYTENPYAPFIDESLQEPMQYHCVECNRSYSSLQNLKYHGYHVHNPDRPRKFREYPDLPYKCDVCKKCYLTLAKLKSHIYYMHVDCPSSLARREKKTKFKFIKRKGTRIDIEDDKITTTFSCKICSRDFTNKLTLDRHKLKWHPNLENRDPSTIFNCNECKITYSSYARLLSHIYYYHPGKYSKTKRSRKLYSSKSKHYSIVRQGKKVMLLLIKPLFNDGKTNNLCKKDDTFIIESKDNDKNRYNCQLCWRRYKTALLLKTHLTFYDHEEDNLKNAFKCKHCNTGYKSWKNLKCHFYYMHPNEKPKRPVLTELDNTSSDDDLISYKCVHCDKKYKLYKHLIAHYYYNHPGIKPKQKEKKENPPAKYIDSSDNNSDDDHQGDLGNKIIIIVDYVARELLMGDNGRG